MAMIRCFMRLFRSRSDLCSQKAHKSLGLATLTAIFFIHQSSHTPYSLNTTGVQSTALIKQGLGGISSQLHSLCFASYLIWRISCFNSLIYAHFSIWFLCSQNYQLSSVIFLYQGTFNYCTYLYVTQITSCFCCYSKKKKPYDYREQKEAFIHVFS